MQFQYQRVLQLLFYYSIALLAGLFIYLSLHVYVADSEFWSMSLGYHFLEDFDKDWVYTRPLFYILLWLSQLNYTTPSAAVYAARGLFVLNTAVMFFFIFKISRQRTQEYFYGAIVCVLLLGNTGFLNQGFRIRSDLLATSLSLACIYILGRKSKTENKFTIVSLLAPMLATPKALLQSVGLVGFIEASLIRKNVRWILGGVSLIGLIWLVLNWHNLDYLYNAFTGQNGNPSYMTKESFFHVLNQIKRNPLFWFLLGARFITSSKIRKKIQASDGVYDDRGFQFLTVFSLLCLFFYTEKVQFFIASLLPFFALHISMIFYDLKEMKWNGARNVLLVVVFVVSTLTGIHWFQINRSENLNRFQLMTLDNTYAFLKKNNVASFYDFTCLIAPLCKTRHFVGPNQPSSNRAAMESMVQNPPEVIFYLPKAHLLEPDLSIFLNQNYLRTPKGAYVRRKELNSPNETSQNEKLPDGQTSQKLDSTIDGMDLDANISGRLSHLFGYDIEY